MKAVMKKIISCMTAMAVMTATGLFTGCAVNVNLSGDIGPAYDAETADVIDDWAPDSPAMLSIVC